MPSTATVSAAWFYPPMCRISECTLLQPVGPSRDRSHRHASALRGHQAGTGAVVADHNWRTDPRGSFDIDTT